MSRDGTDPGTFPFSRLDKPAAPPGAAHAKDGASMPGRILCFTLGAVAPLASVGWLLAFH